MSCGLRRPKTGRERIHGSEARPAVAREIDLQTATPRVAGSARPSGPRPIRPAGYPGQRAAATAIYFLLQPRRGVRLARGDLRRAVVLALRRPARAAPRRRRRAARAEIGETLVLGPTSRRCWCRPGSGRRRARPRDPGVDARGQRGLPVRVRPRRVPSGHCQSPPGAGDADRRRGGRCNRAAGVRRVIDRRWPGDGRLRLRHLRLPGPKPGSRSELRLPGGGV